MPLAGVVLCGGKSSRMGTEKAFIEVDGQPLVLRVAGRLASICDPVMLATGTPGRVGPLGYPEVADAYTDAGPLAGLAAALEASPHEALAVVAVDMPHVSPAVLSFLASLRGTEDAVVPVSDRGVEPLHAVYARSSLPLVMAALEGDDRSLHGLLSQLHVRLVPGDEWQAADPTGAFATNLNTPG